MIEGSKGCSVHASSSDISLYLHGLYLKIVTSNPKVESKCQCYILLDATMMLRQDANTIRKEIKKMTQIHVRKIITLQQRLLKVSIQKESLSPMCIMLECVKFEFNEVDTYTVESEAKPNSSAKTHKQDSCCNPSLGLVTEVRVYKSCGPRMKPKSHIHAPGSARECKGMNPHTPK